VNILIEQKPFLSPEELIHKMDVKGITFEHTSYEEALKYLKKNNNYYKLTSYRKNFQKDEEGKYIGLDFAALVDLAIVDMLFRYQVINMALDIEHFEKVKLLTFLKNQGSDGYDVVESYKQSLETQDQTTGSKQYAKLETEISNNETSVYCHDMLSHIKPGERMPVWVFTEVVSFGTFRNFFEFCVDRRYPTPDLIEEAYRLKKVKSIRNAAGHSNCIFNDLTINAPESKDELNKAVLNRLASSNIMEIKTDDNGKRIEPVEIQNDRIKEIITLFFVHSRILPSMTMKAHYKDELQSFALRMNTHLDDYYKGSLEILNAFSIIQKIIETWY